MDFCGGDGDEEIELSLGLAIGGGGRRKREAVSAEVDGLVKRKEMQAQRRQEARRKREEKKKQMKRSGAAVDGGDERGAGKREKFDSESQAEGVKSDVAAADQSCSAYAFPIYAYPSTIHYVPLANGFAFPCIAPVYAAPESDVSNKSVTSNPQTVSFRPFQGGNKSPLNEEGNVKAVSNGGCSSAVSENRSISSQGGSSSDSASHWSRPRSAKTEQYASSGSDVPGSSNKKAFSNPSAVTNAEKANNAPPATLSQPTSTKVVSKEDATAVELKTANTPITRVASLPQPMTPVSKDNKADINSPVNPPRPRPVDNQKPSCPLSQMPCVSATGNGPDGKTITGFLYRYNTTAEVSIVCVCHGESFSPAEFVKHAGGIDISHPLRRITVVPSAF